MTNLERAANCRHEHIVDPPPGKHLRVCLDCANRLIECDGCDAKLSSGPHVVGSGWMGQGQAENGVVTEWTWCPDCWARRP